MRLTPIAVASRANNKAVVTLLEGQQLRGNVSSYKVLKQFACGRDVWKAIDQSSRYVVVKRSLPHLMKLERDALEIVRGRPCIRQMVDYVEDLPSLVLEYMEDNLLDVSRRKRVEGAALKLVARSVLEALAALHEAGYVHTVHRIESNLTKRYDVDVKPDNILVDYSEDSIRFSKVVLGDCGDVYKYKKNPDSLKFGHLISAAIFRSPEAQLNLRWGPPTDIWSLGATLISLIFGGNWHIFTSPQASVDDEHYIFWVLVEQIRHFGPFHESFEEIADEERLTICTAAIDYIIDHQKWRPFSKSEDEELAPQDRDFISKMMKLDPRDRPTARELLQDPWFKS